MAMMARGLEIPHGDGTREGLAVANAVALEGFTERDGAILADRMVAAARMVFDEAGGQPPDPVCPTPMGRMPVGTPPSYLAVHETLPGAAGPHGGGAPRPVRPAQLPPMLP